jgi:VWFA-related protein
MQHFERRARLRTPWVVRLFVLAAVLTVVLLSMPAFGLSAEGSAAAAPAAAPAVPAAAQDPEPKTSDEAAPLRREHRQWLEEVGPILSEAEREAFLALSRDYQRDAFIRIFWRVRDPFPETAANELRDIWEQRVEIARTKYDDLEDARAQALLLYGEPEDVAEVRCSSVLQPLEVWRYSGSAFIRGAFSLVLVRLGGRDRYRLWSPQETLYPLLSFEVPTSISEPEIIDKIATECFRGDQLLLAFETTLNWAQIESPVPDPGDEWLKSFVAATTDLPDGAETFPAELAVSFPGRHQSRTVVQGVIRVPAAQLEVSDLDGGATYNLLVDGEIVRRGELFESFRYRFQFPAETPSPTFPMIFERYLRPGDYQLVVRARDLTSGRYYRDERELIVPVVTRHAPESLDLAGGAGVPDAGGAGGLGGGVEPAGDAQLEEANASLSSEGQTLRLLPPAPGLLVGNARIEADDRPVMSKRNPPYSVELQLGTAPRTHRVTAVAVDAEGQEVARDEILLNAGPHRFAVRLVEPRRGGRYRASVRARAEVEVPEGETLDRVEFYLNDTLVATAYQPPFIQPLVIPEGMPIAYVRTVAYLADGNTSEDLVFVNAPDYLEELKVQFVELYTTVLDRRGRPAEGLTQEDFRVLEDGVEQEIRRFEKVTDIPIYAGVVLDTSASMSEELDQAVRGALQFFQTVITPKDRAAVITFNDQHDLAVRFTNNLEVLAGGVAGVVAEGETNLYDSLVYALYYFSGVKGKRALILLSDGEDVGSRYRFEDVLEYARRTGVAIYTIGLGLPAGSRDIQVKLSKLSDETGGRAFLIDRAADLGRVYETIETELRSQYLIAYQSSSKNDDEKYRSIELEVLRPGLEAKTMRGYFP